MSAPSAVTSEYRFGYSKATLSSHASRTLNSDASFVIPHVKPSHKVLDVGCGPGTITIGFASLINTSEGGSVTGVDAGAPVLQMARELADARDLSSKVVFRQANVLLEGLPFPDSTFDLVFTSHMLTHLAPAPDAPVAALKEMRRVLKPGGLLASRDAALIMYQPYREELQRCLIDRMFKVIGTGEPCGSHMPRYLRMAGFDMTAEGGMDDEGRVGSGKVQIGGGVKILTGREKCHWWRDTMGGRLAKGDVFRDNWLKEGITDEECDETMALLNRWAESEDAWHGVLQTEVLAWK